ncbi:unnamed protein product [Musa hybrid cultivar]
MCVPIALWLKRKVDRSCRRSTLVFFRLPPCRELSLSICFVFFVPPPLFLPSECISYPSSSLRCLWMIRGTMVWLTGSSVPFFAWAYDTSLFNLSHCDFQLQ